MSPIGSGSRLTCHPRSVGVDLTNGGNLTRQSSTPHHAILLYLHYSRRVYIWGMDEQKATPAREYFRLNLLLLLLSLLFVVFSFYPGSGIWGAGIAIGFPVWLRIAILILLLIIIYPPYARQAGEALSSLIQGSNGVRWQIYFGFCAVLLMLFIIMPSRNHLLGDGYLLINSVQQKGDFWPLEPLEYYAHRWLFLLLGGTEAAAYLAFRVWSIFTGALFLVGLYFLTRNRANGLMTLALALGFGTMQFFFGYAENYSTSFVLMFFYMLLAGRDLESGKVSIPTILVLLMSIGFHLGSVIMTPSLICLFWKIWGNTRKFKLAGSVVAISSMGLAVFVLHRGLPGPLQLFVPLLSGTNAPYHLFSLDHLRDLLSILLLVFPLLLALPLFGGIRWLKLNRFYLVAIIPGLLYTILIDPKLGALRDWDFLALGAAAVLGLLIYLVDSRPQERPSSAYASLIPLLLFALLHTGGWIALNHSRENSYAFVKNTILSDPHYSSRYAGGYRNKSWALLAENNYGDIEEAIRARQALFAGNPDDFVNVSQLTQSYAKAGDTAAAQALLMRNYIRYLSQAENAAVMGQLLTEMNRIPQAESIYQAYIDFYNEDYRIVNNLGLLMEREGKLDSAFFLYELAYRMDPDASGEEQLMFYIYCISHNYYQTADGGIRRIYGMLNPEQKLLAEDILRALAYNDKEWLDALAASMGGRK